MNSRFRSWRVLSSALLLIVALLTTTTSLVATADPGIAPPNSKVLGRSYGEWGAAWWQWVFSLPAQNPVNPQLATGEVDCSYGQQGQVWFLAGTFSAGELTRTCTIPTGTRLFFPIYNAWADVVAENPQPSVEELRERAAAFAAASELHVTIDGTEVQNPFQYRAAYAPFAYMLPGADNLLSYLFGVSVPGADWPSLTVFPAASDGYWIMLQPLPPGTHTITLGGTSSDGSFSFNITHNITVIPKGRF
jgi:hypothetical protein